jgi:putative flavoprotein involved in K+ transport
VYLATSPVGRAPARHRGRDTVEWLVECGFFDQRPDDLVDRSVISAPQPLLAPGGRSASLQTLARSGATLLGRLVNVEGDRVTFASDLARTIAAADAYAARIRAVLDAAIARARRSAPPMEVDEADAPVHLDPPTQLQLREHDITSVLWCTGYTGDFSWLNPALTDHDGQPRRHGAAALVPGPGIWDCAGSPVAAPATSSVFPPTRPSSRTPWLPRYETAADLLRIRPRLSDIGLVRHWACQALGIAPP